MKLQQEILELVLTKIAENVKCQRKKKGMSQLNLALAMGHKSVGLVSFVEAGINNRRFNLEHLANIAKILDISILKLFEGVDEILQVK